jgi:hypothetical protein
MGAGLLLAPIFVCTFIFTQVKSLALEDLPEWYPKVPNLSMARAFSKIQNIRLY